MAVAVVAIPRGPPRTLFYAIPAELTDAVEVGRRVLVPLGQSGRRTTGYVVDVRPDDEADALELALKPISDVLDGTPLFEPGLLALFRFVASYYRAPLGDVIRTGLPAGLNVTEARVAELTDLGRTRADGDPVLKRLREGPVPVKALRATTATLLRRATDGLLVLRYELERARIGAKYLNVVTRTEGALGAPLRPGQGPALLLALLEAEGPLESRALEGRIPGAAGAVKRLVELGLARVERVQVYRDPWTAPPRQDTPPALTLEQQRAVTQLADAVALGRYCAFLLQGVTGSGKTEVYLHAIAHTLALGRMGLVLVPEIALTPQLAGRFRARFGDRVAVLHSGLADGQRLDQWERIRRGDCPVVVGARSALFAPFPEGRLGLIVVDEEHDPSFKQADAPRYHGRDLALKRAQDARCPIVLGSATPSMESVANVERGRLVHLRLTERVGARPLPEVEIVDLRDTPPVRREGLLSPPLIDALRDTVKRGEQAILFLNRRGWSACLTCTKCEHVPQCPACSVALTFHKRDRRLACHYCGHQRAVPGKCPDCGDGELGIDGTGTEQVESVLREVLPEARVDRMDRDTTSGSKLEALLERFREGRIDVLVGTQMVAKGHDFPMVTLVGVLLAEQLLRLPDFRAAERTFQLLTQVAGRAGRHDRPGRVLFQTWDPDHYALKCAVDHDVDRFLGEESRRRRLRGFPPVTHLVLARLDDEDPNAVRDAAGRLARRVRALAQAGTGRVDVIGPALAPIERIAGRTRYQVLLRGPDRAALHRVLSELELTMADLVGSVRTSFDVDPMELM